MERDVHNLIMWFRLMMAVSAVCASSVPVIYSFAPWRKSLLGKALMWQATAFAATFVVASTFSYWTPKNILVVFWCYIIALVDVALATTFFVVAMVITSNTGRKAKHRAVQQ